MLNPDICCKFANMRKDNEESGSPSGFVEPEGHHLGEIHEIEFSRGMFEAECECSNPDGEGVGLVRFTGSNAEDVRAQFEEHCETLLD